VFQFILFTKEKIKKKKKQETTPGKILHHAHQREEA
jgi:hypothetical protein